MLANDAFSSHYTDVLEGRYDCVDRIILNAYFAMGCSPGGFRTWWRNFDGSDENCPATITFPHRVASRNNVTRIASRVG